MNDAPAQDFRASLADGETITIEQWLNDTSITAGTRVNRRNWLSNYSAANGGKDPREIVEDIRAGRVKVYQTARQLVDHLRKKDLKPSTVGQMRSMFPGFAQSVLGEDWIKRTVFDRLVPAGDFYISTSKKSPTRDDLRQMLRLAAPQYRAVLGIMACTGMRISEAVSRKLSDLEENKATRHVRVKLQAGETKARSRRYAFLTKETVEWVNQYRLDLEAQARQNHQAPSGWLFPGEKHGHLTTGAAFHRIKRLFKMAGCEDIEDEVYSPHSFRTFADTQMAKAGLDRKFISAIIGHKSRLASESHYLDWNEIETEWYELCETKMTWLIERIEIIKEVHDVEARNVLSKLVKALTQAETFDDIGDVSGLLDEGEKLLEDKSGSKTSS